MPASLSDRPADAPSPPAFNAPAVVLWLTGLTVALHLLRIVLPDNAQFELLQRFGFIAARYSVEGAYAADPLAYLAGPVGYAFLHGGWGHLFLNMAFLMAFGAPVARRMAAAPFLLLYFCSSIAGAFFWAWLEPLSTVPLIGASGAISGLVGAIGMLSLRAGQSGPLGDRRTALAFVAVWLGTNLLIGLLPFGMPFESGDIAWEAHIAGFVAGALLIRGLDGRGRPGPTDNS
ncbi:MAG: rhomboid family intramembrane serine protease [Alphaproteobacteria bacterium]